MSGTILSCTKPKFVELKVNLSFFVLISQRLDHRPVRQVRLWRRRLLEEESGPVQLQRQHREPGPIPARSALLRPSEPAPAGTPRASLGVLVVPPAVLGQVRTDDPVWLTGKLII